ncbi:MAG: hypothetical protein GWM98_22080 [Nitrospinaceae bacterium]|nr:hypothetical protein [Nitrospinaceae bacterium]NIR56647.1 hypothetical protein [Nitrospinaceae bacterium]NIS87110.1 hypothetical protein [Nitrospinaceae bacterium]NIT83964.1 hypothetical protein [Nitrospinaceae bacterium]NIU46155.1 hypothetical protein [Nitrospinaceae bacterium]
MAPEKETQKTIQARLNILQKSLVSEENSVQYYQTLLDNTAADTEENIGARRMYLDLQIEEKKHVKTIQDLIQHWEEQLKNLKNG